MTTKILQIGTENLDPKKYSNKDLSLIGEFVTSSQFNPNTDTIEYYIYDINNNLKSYAPDYRFYTIIQPDVSLGDNTNTISINVEQDLKRRGNDQGTYQPVYNFFRNQLESSFRDRFFIKEISPSRTEIRLSNNFLDDSTLDIAISDFISQRNSSEYFQDFFLNFGDNIQFVANNIILDTTDPTDFTVLIKLYNPLPSSFTINDTLWVTTEVADPRAFLVEFPPEEIEDEDVSLSLRGPNFNIEIKDEIGNATNYQTLNDLLDNTQLTSSYNQLQNVLEQKGISINLDYGLDTVKFENFIHFSSADQRLRNFYYKIGVIEKANTNISNLNSLSGTSDTSSSLAENEQTVKDTIKSFDGFENFMYYNSSSEGDNGTTWPKSNSVAPYNLKSTGDIGTWYNRMLNSASLYDQENSDNLIYAIPGYLRDDPENAPYELFIEMMGQYFDQLYFYTEDITNKHDADNRLNFGVSKDLVADVLKSFGIKLYENNFSSDDLYASLLGINASGSLLPPTGSEVITEFVTASNSAIPLNDVNKETYKRIYHNMPYLLKKKGTVEGVRALINLFGIPDTILRISEFGGKDKDNTNDWDYTQNVFNKAAFNSGSSATSFISTSFKLNSNWDENGNSISPSSVLFRFKPPNILPSSNNYAIISKLDNPSSTTDGHLILTYTGSSYTSGSYSGSIPSSSNKEATLAYWAGSGAEIVETKAPFYDGNWWGVQLSKTSGSSTQTYTLRTANNIYDGADGFKIGYTASVTNTKSNSVWNNASQFYLGNKDGSGVTINSQTYKGLTGSFQELRFYNTVLEEETFHDFVMNPYSIEGATFSSSADNLVFRAPLGSDLKTNTGIISSSHPKITGSNTTHSFSDNSAYEIGSNIVFTNNTEFIYQDQPAVGIKNRISEKIRFTTADTASGGDVLTPYRSIRQYYPQSESYTRDVNYVEVAFSPQNEINDDINSSFGYFNIGEYIGDPSYVSESRTSYNSLDKLRDTYFEKYYKNYNWNDYIRLIKYFDNSLFKMIKDFVPAKSGLTTGVVIKQHLLERNRQRPANLSFEQLTYSGSITSGFIKGGSAGVYDDTSISYTKSADLYNGELTGSAFTAVDSHTQDTGSFTQPYYDTARTSSFYMDADYSSGISGSRFPINFEAIKDGTAIKAPVQNSNYTITGIVNSRYKGTKVTSPSFNKI